MLSRMEADEKGSLSPQAVAGPGGLHLPQRASIYIDVDGSVHFGALFEGLVPVAQSLGAPDQPPAAPAQGVALAPSPGGPASGDGG